VVFPTLSLRGQSGVWTPEIVRATTCMAVIHRAWWGGPSFWGNPSIWGNDFRLSLFRGEERPEKYPRISAPPWGWSYTPLVAGLPLSITRALRILRKDFMPTAVQLPDLAGVFGQLGLSPLPDFEPYMILLVSIVRVRRELDSSQGQHVRDKL
jgi:hypothetical protein